MSIAQPYYPPTNGGGFGGEGGSTGSVNDRDYMAGKLLRAIESILFFIVIFQFSTALIALLFTDPIDLDSQSLFARALWYPGYAIVLLLALSNLPKIVRLVAFNPVLVVCILWCGLSYIWSIDPSVTLRRSIALLMTTLFGLVLAARFDWDELIIRIAVVFLSLALISLFLGIFIPDLGKMAAISDVYADSWRGAWIEKNSFGTNMSKGLLIMMCAFAMRPKQWWIWVPGGILCFVLVLLSTSKAALLAALVMILGFLVIRVFRRFPVLRIPLMYGVVLSISVFTFLIIFMPDMMFEIIG
ncbi:MAG: hypothetical protein JKX72_11400, partial [Robiginitomaculum sp.]|nr:hypothetical protein [Robiginitomaculum sp.]